VGLGDSEDVASHPNHFDVLDGSRVSVAPPVNLRTVTVRKFWLLDQHGDDGPTALVETDGRLLIVDVLRFGPSITELDDQQKVWDQVIGRVAPTMKPCVTASSIDEEGIAPLPDLRRGDPGAAGTVNRAGRRKGTRVRGDVGRPGGGPRRTGSRGER